MLSIAPPPGTTATPAQIITLCIILMLILPIVLIPGKIFPIIELTENKILAYDFHNLGVNLENYNSSSEESRIIQMSEVKRSLQSCEEELTNALSDLPDFWTEDTESSLKSLLSAIYKIHHTVKTKETIDEKLLKEIFELSDILHEEKSLSPKLKRRITTIDSLLKKTGEEPISVPLLSQLLKGIIGFPRWVRNQSELVRFGIYCVFTIFIFCGGAYLTYSQFFSGAPIGEVYAGIMAVFAACLGISAVLAKK